MTQRMDPEIKAQWVAALRSGDFQQGKGVLHRVTDVNGNGTETHEFCCLGVLSECAVAVGKAERKFGDTGYFRYYDPADDEFGGNGHYLPRVVKVWAGFRDANPSLMYEGDFHSLAELNDDFQLSFSEIADLIEDQL